MALGAGSKKEGIAKNLTAPSQTRMRTMKAAAGAKRSKRTGNRSSTESFTICFRRGLGCAASCCDGATEETAADVIGEFMECGLRQRLHRSRPSQRYVQDLSDTSGTAGHDNDAVGKQQSFRDRMGNEQDRFGTLRPDP